MVVGAAGIAAACGWSVHAQDNARANSGCSGEIIGAGTLAHGVDGRTFVLSDGREIRLAAIETPLLPGPLDKDPSPERCRRQGGPRGSAVRRRKGHPQASRSATRRTGTAGWWLMCMRRAMGSIIRSRPNWSAAGYARVADRVGSRACAIELLRRETLARKAKLGLWASSYYALLNAENPTDVLAERGHFALVEGKVLSVRESGATIYVNFGKRWTEDFTVTILKRNERNFTAVGLDPKTLAGRKIRVRGWIEERGGPWIDATRPEQIEFADRD